MGILLKHIFGLNKVFWSVRASVGSSNNMNKLSSVGITKLVSKKVEGGGEADTPLPSVATPSSACENAKFGLHFEMGGSAYKMLIYMVPKY
jgi:hypothetical protein